MCWLRWKATQRCFCPPSGREVPKRRGTQGHLGKSGKGPEPVPADCVCWIFTQSWRPQHQRAVEKSILSRQHLQCHSRSKQKSSGNSRVLPKDLQRSSSFV